MFLGIDVGTTSVKVILTDDHLRYIATASSPLSVSHPAPLCSEQNPEDWWIGLNHAMSQLRDQYPQEMKKVIAIGLSGQQHGATLLDKSGNVLRPAILWNDGRASAECIELMEKIPHSKQITGSIMMPGFTAPKLLWIKKHEPELFKKIDKILLPKDYLRFLMSGDFATDLSDASGTGWLDIEKREWSTTLLSACELTTHHMPHLFDGNVMTSTIKKSIAAQWRLSDNVNIVAGAGDNAASAMSMGSVNNHTVYLSLGTSATFFRAINNYAFNTGAGIHTFCHAVPAHWHHMAVHLNGASCLSWASRLFNHSIPELLAAAEKNHHHNAVLFVPYLSGERTPHNNPNATGALLGLNHAANPASIMQAVLEGVAFGLREGYDAMIHDPQDISEITVVGGGAKSRYWGKIIASILNAPLTYRQSSAIGSAFGAAKLAWLAKTQADPCELFSMPEVENVIDPETQWVSRYEEKYYMFQKAYQNTNLDQHFVFGKTQRAG